ncbi:MAG: hypothetical protein JWO77_2063 [Ilumatobacteraceae bacterium]|nr:hypothetical protein [Ilumatobacteraceae bacterium]
MAPPTSSSPLVLFVDGRAVAPVEVAGTRRARARGLLGRAGIDGALLLPATSSVHTFAMRFAIDIALCTAELEVLRVRTLEPGTLVLPRRAVRTVVEAEAGSFARWQLAAGARLAVG